MKLWVTLVLVALVVAVAVVAGPFLVGRTQWAMHRVFDYQGVKIDLPAGWVRDGTASGVSFVKPGVPLLNDGLDSRFTMARLGGDADARAAEMKRWLALGKEPAVQDMEFPGENGAPPRRLLCARVEMSQLEMVEVRCIVEDSSWSFSFLGSAPDVEEARSMMRSTMTHDGLTHEK